MLHVDNDEYALESVLIVNDEVNSMVLPISPSIPQDQVSVETSRALTVGGIVSKGIAYFGNRVPNEIVNLLLGFAGERKGVQVRLIRVLEVNVVGQDGPPISSSLTVGRVSSRPSHMRSGLPQCVPSLWADEEVSLCPRLPL